MTRGLMGCLKDKKSLVGAKMKNGRKLYDFFIFFVKKHH